MSDQSTVPTRLFTGTIANDRIDLGTARDDFAALKRSLEGRRICIAMWEKFNPDDILQLRGYFHGYVLPEIAKAAGWAELDAKTLAHVKHGLKERFLIDPETGEIPSTETLGKSLYWQFIENCRQYSAETLHHYIEDPDRAKLLRLANSRTTS